VSLYGVGNALPREWGYSISGRVAPGEIVSFYGIGLGPAAGAEAQVDGAGRIVTELGGTRVLFDGVPAPLLYAGANQINAVVPFAAGDRPITTVELQSAYGRSSATGLGVAAADAVLLAVSTASPTFYPVLILNQDGSINSGSNRASPGEIVTFWVNGAGRFDPPLTDGAIIRSERSRPILPVSVTLTGEQELPAEILYAGAAPGMVAGMLQVNARVPLEAVRSTVAMRVRVGDSIAIGSLAIQ
jgi:uncharacterized protein (TIGR03437 family)